MTDDNDLQIRVAALQARSVVREAQRSSRLRIDADECGFTDFYRAFQKQFGPGVRILYFRGSSDSYGQPQPAGVPFSDPPPEPLKRGKRA